MLKATKKLQRILSEKQKKQVIGLVILMLIGGVMEAMSVSIVFPLISAVTDAENYGSKWYAKAIINIFNISDQVTYVKILLLLLIFMFVFKNAFLVFEYFIQNSFIAKGKYNMQKNLMHNYLNKPYVFFLNTSSGDLIQVVARDTSRAFNLLQNALIFYTEVIVAVVLAITIVIISPSISIVMGIVLLIELGLIAKIIKPINGQIGIANRAEESAANKWFLQAISGIKSIKVEDRMNFFEEKYTKHTKQISEYDRTFQTLTYAPKCIIEACTVATVLLYILVMVASGQSMIALVPQLSAFMVAAMRLLPSMNRISNVMNQTPFIEVGLDNVLKVLDKEDLDVNGNAKVTPGQVTDNLDEDNSDKPEVTFNNSIELKDISFRYPSGEKQILDRANMKISVGESVGIVGPSGAGKTTAVDIILGLLEPQGGKILVDGTDIYENMKGWLSHVSYIPQQIFLLDDTIRANVAFGMHKNETNDERVWEALKDAQMDEFVKTLPDGLDTRVGEAGVRLSGGQRQRIGIARALYYDPDILFFDEATSALDNETEAAIMESIEHLKGRKTLIIIAHRLTTIENCDVVFRVENGLITKER